MLELENERIARGLLNGELTLTDACVEAGLDYASDDQLLASGFSSGTLGAVLAEAADVALRDGFTSIAPEMSLSDAVAIPVGAATFKDHNVVDFSIDSLLEEIVDGSDAKYASFSANNRPVAVGLYAKKLAFSRQMIRSNSVDLVAAGARALGYAARLLVEEQAATVLEALTYDGTNSSSTAALDAAAIDAAILLLRNQVQGDAALYLRPAYLCVAPAQEAAARTLLVPDSGKHRDIQMVVSPNLTSGYAYLVHQSAVHAPLSVAYLDSAENDAPSVSLEQSRFSVLGSELTCVHAFGFAERDRTTSIRITVTG